MDPDEQAEQAAARERGSKRIIPKAAREAAAQAGVKFVGDAETGPVHTLDEPFIVPVSPAPPPGAVGHTPAPPGSASAVKVVMDALVELRTRIDALEQWASEVQTALTFQAGQIDMLGKARAAGTPRPKPARDAG